MELRTAARLSGIAGGGCWLARYVLDAAGSGEGTASDVLYWVGLALVFLALVGLGTGLVNKGAVWLQAIVAVAFPALVWSVLEAFDPGIAPSLGDAVFGGGLLLLCVQQLVRAGRRKTPASEPGAARTSRRADRSSRSGRSHGSHSR